MKLKKNNLNKKVIVNVRKYKSDIYDLLGNYFSSYHRFLYMMSANLFG